LYTLTILISVVCLELEGGSEGTSEAQSREPTHLSTVVHAATKRLCASRVLTILISVLCLELGGESREPI
jgi:hypothetical protein